MKCVVKLNNLKSTLGDVFLCHRGTRVFVSHRNNRVTIDDTIWEDDQVPERYRAYIREI